MKNVSAAMSNPVPLPTPRGDLLPAVQAATRAILEVRRRHRAQMEDTVLPQLRIDTAGFLSLLVKFHEADEDYARGVTSGEYSLADDSHTSGLAHVHGILVGFRVELLQRLGYAFSCGFTVEGADAVRDADLDDVAFAQVEEHRIKGSVRPTGKYQRVIGEVQDAAEAADAADPEMAAVQSEMSGRIAGWRRGRDAQPAHP